MADREVGGMKERPGVVEPGLENEATEADTHPGTEEAAQVAG